jgi:CRP-like cAMP-binding protein
MTDQAETPDLRRNTLLRSLPEDEFNRLAEQLETRYVDVREQVYVPDQPIECFYFPLTAVFSFVAEVDGEVVVECGTIGAEGVVGLPAFLGARTSPQPSFCQVAGFAAVIPTGQLQQFLQRDGSLHARVNRYTQAMIMQLAQNVACNRIHSTEERACRWLLMTQDRVGADTFQLTQEFLAQMLGVRRPTVSQTASVLQSAGLIRYSRGRVTVVDRDGLEAASCGCYELLRTEFARLLDPGQ